MSSKDAEDKVIEKERIKKLVEDDALMGYNTLRVIEKCYWDLHKDHYIAMYIQHKVFGIIVFFILPLVALVLELLEK